MAKIAMTQKNSQGQKTVSSNQKAFTKSEQREIEKLAYDFFLERGSEHGHDQKDWLRAEAIVLKRR